MDRLCVNCINVKLLHCGRTGMPKSHRHRPVVMFPDTPTTLNLSERSWIPPGKRSKFDDAYRLMRKH